MKRLDWFLARRYLSSRKKGRLLSLITWIALGGVIVGVTALVVVLSVMNGAQKDLRDMILGATPHIYVLEHGSSLRLDNWQQVIGDVQEADGVEFASPFVLASVGLVRGDISAAAAGGDQYAQAADLYGVATDTGAEKVTDVEARVGELLGGPVHGLPRVVVAERLANRMDLFEGDTVVIAAFETIRPDALGNLMPDIRQFVVAGTVRTGVYDYDIKNVYMRLPDAQELLGILGIDQITGISVRLDDPFRAGRVGDALREDLGFPYRVETWITTNRALFEALKLEKLAMGIILFLILLVAAFNIVSTLVMVVADRTREIGILKSMGMTDGMVKRVFVLQGIWVGAIGTLLGVGLGLVVCAILSRYPIFRLAPEIYSLDRLPVSVEPLDLLLVVLGSLAISLVATWYPSTQASRLDPVEAIRHE